MNDYLDGEYFGFHLNAPYLIPKDGFEESSYTGVLYQKQDGILVPVGNRMKDFVRQATGRPSIEDLALDTTELGIKRLYTTSLMHYPDTILWGLVNLYKNDNDIDPYPVAEIYSQIDPNTSELTNKGIEVVTIFIDKRFL